MRLNIEIGICFNTIEIINKNTEITVQKLMKLKDRSDNRKNSISEHPPINQEFRLLDQLQDILGNAASLCHDRRAGLGHNLLSGHLNSFSCELHVLNSNT